MVKSSKEIHEGEHWAYRENRTAALEEVRILKVGVKRRFYALLAFLDPEQEGLEAWRPIQRLIIPWADRETFLVQEAALEAADAISPQLTEGEVMAIAFAMGAADAEGCLDSWVGGSRAMMRITDFRLLAIKLGPGADEIPSHPLSFNDNTGRVIPWPVVEWILRRLAQRYPEECLSAAEDCDDEIEDIRTTHSTAKQGVRDPRLLKMLREYRETSEALRRWVNGSTD